MTRFGLLLVTAATLAMPPLAAQTTAPPAASGPAASGPAPSGPAAPARLAPPARPSTTMLKPTPVDDGDTSKPRQRFVTVFGTDTCPKPTSKDEIVVCTRLPEAEQYRIPSRLRNAEGRVSAFEYNRKLLLGDRGSNAGGAGQAIGSCSAIGPSGHVGCTNSQINAWAADRTSRMGYDEPVPPQ